MKYRGGIHGMITNCDTEGVIRSTEGAYMG